MKRTRKTGVSRRSTLAMMGAGMGGADFRMMEVMAVMR